MSVEGFGEAFSEGRTTLVGDASRQPGSTITARVSLLAQGPQIGPAALGRLVDSELDLLGADTEFGGIEDGARGCREPAPLALGEVAGGKGRVVVWMILPGSGRVFRQARGTVRWTVPG